MFVLRPGTVSYEGLATLTFRGKTLENTDFFGGPSVSNTYLLTSLLTYSIEESPS